ncbi:MAG TPA: hypothetical protein VGI39_01495 [Polyangiaceae bacterium]|jgi:hypothetical protein
MSEEQTPIHGKGLVHRPWKHHRLGAPHPTEGAAPSPPAASLRRHRRLRLNQGRSEGCVAHALSTAMRVVIAQLVALGLAASSWEAFEASVRWFWATIRSEEDAGTGPLPNEGVDMVDCITALDHQGMIDWPRNADGSVQLSPDGRVSDVWTEDDVKNLPSPPPANMHARPTAAESELGRKRGVDTSRVQLLDPTQADFEDHVRAAISATPIGWPVLVGIHATSALQLWGDRWVPNQAPFADPTGCTENDLHGVVVLDYRTEADGSTSYWISNSWGDWGEEAGIWVTGAEFRALCVVAMRFEVSLKAVA